MECTNLFFQECFLLIDVYVQTYFWKINFCALHASCVRASYNLCARTHANSLEGTLVMVQPIIKIHSNKGLLIFSVFCGRNVSRLIFLKF